MLYTDNEMQYVCALLLTLPACHISCMRLSCLNGGRTVGWLQSFSSGYAQLCSEELKTEMMLVLL